MKVDKIIFSSVVENIRIDKYIAEICSDFSRSHISKLIQDNEITVNDKFVKPKYLIKKGDKITINIIPPKTIDLSPQNLTIDILFQDSSICVINKPAGLVVHPSPGHYDKTLVNALLYHIKDLSGINSEIRPGIVHRLDKDTSGLMVVAKNDMAHRELASFFKNRKVKKYYKALVFGIVKPEKGRIESFIGRDKFNRIKFSSNTTSGKIAITNYQVERYFKNYTLLDINIETGRTHQIRVHFSEKGHPIVGDTLYSKRKSNLNRLFLHAYRLVFPHPVNKKIVDFKIELPNELKNFLEKCFGD